MTELYTQQVTPSHLHGFRFKNNRNSIGVEIDPEYCQMAARYLKAESSDLFSDAKLIFEKATTREEASLVREDREVYEIQPARKRMK